MVMCVFLVKLHNRTRIYDLFMIILNILNIINNEESDLFYSNV